MRNQTFENVSLAGASLTGGAAVATAVASLAGLAALPVFVPILGGVAGLIVSLATGGFDKPADAVAKRQD